ncbi:MAG: hypothetical protein AOA65_0753 [Candidatus Bathyarchaeota archaeon BA1]|nr:MAG: hypothetical protein AOA65_0753 [Candidatus Bathyarchaeota archaeon BA1]
MKSNPEVEIIDVTKNSVYERYLYKCLSPIPFRRYRKRHGYLENAIPKSFHKKLLIFNGKILGQIEYAPAEASGYPIMGDGIIVMNCIWVLRKAKGRNLGKQLLTNMMESEKGAVGFATIALENHWSPWMRIEQMEKLGFKPLDSVKVMHKTKHEGRCFKIHLMWLSTIKNAKSPTWDKSKLMEGVDFCLAHPLYHPEKTKLKEIFEEC